MSQSVAEGFNAYCQQGEQSTYDAEALVEAIFVGTCLTMLALRRPLLTLVAKRLLLVQANKVVRRPLRRTIRTS